MKIKKFNEDIDIFSDDNWDEMEQHSKISNNEINKYLTNKIDECFNGLFDDIVKDFHLESGDINPTDTHFLDQIKLGLKDILVDYIRENK